MDIRTESDLLSLVGESESIALEFKGPEDFLLWPQSKPSITKSLSKEVSAFANTYGGQIVVGVKETRELPRKAEAIEGIDPSNPPIETIQRLIESNIHPRLEGVRYWVIGLSHPGPRRVVYVISVPQGRTAHQANDKLYYGRSEFESVPLEDQLIRYKMVRERLAEATIDVVDAGIETSKDEYNKRQKQLEDLREPPADDEGFVVTRQSVLDQLDAPPRDFDEYRFSILIRNTGTITIRDCLLSLEISGLPTANWGWRKLDNGIYRSAFRLSGQNTVRTIQQHGHQEAIAHEAKLFPTQEAVFPGASHTFRVPTETDVGAASLSWKLYFDDSPSVHGRIELGQYLKSLSSNSVDPRKMPPRS